MAGWLLAAAFCYPKICNIRTQSCDLTVKPYILLALDKTVMFGRGLTLCAYCVSIALLRMTYYPFMSEFLWSPVTLLSVRLFDEGPGQQVHISILTFRGAVHVVSAVSWKISSMRQVSCHHPSKVQSSCKCMHCPATLHSPSRKVSSFQESYSILSSKCTSICNMHYT